MKIASLRTVGLIGGAACIASLAACGSSDDQGAGAASANGIGSGGTTSGGTAAAVGGQANPNTGIGGAATGGAATAAGSSTGGTGGAATASGGAQTITGGATTSGQGGGQSATGGTTGGATSTGGVGGAGNISGSAGSGTDSGGDGSGATGGGDDNATGGVGGSTGGQGSGSGGTAGQGGLPEATGGQAGGDDPPEGAVPTISNLTVEPNPNSTISCFVSWTTDVAASSEVRFGEGGYEFRIMGGSATTEHRMLVIGMHAQSEYLIQAVSTTTGGEGTAEASFATGTLPEQVPVGTVTINSPTQSQQGWTLTNIMHGNGSGAFSSTTPSAMVMYDELGEPVWYYVNGTTAENRGDVSCDYLDNGNVLIGAQSGEPPREIDLAGDIVWEGPAQGAESVISHYTGKLTNGNYLVLREYRSPTYNVTGALIEELDASNQVVWSWNIFDHVEPPSGASTDWCHGNSVTTFLDQDLFYLSCRWLGVFKVERSTGNVVWHMAATTGEMAGDVSISPEEARMTDQHDPEIHDDGTILLFDNGGWDGMGAAATERHSRVLEFAMDEALPSATRIWEFPGTFDVDLWYSQDMYLPYWGDADRLANGNILIAAGVRDASKQTRIFEVVRDDGQVVWELQLPADNGVFRAQRISPPPVVERIE